MVKYKYKEILSWTVFSQLQRHYQRPRNNKTGVKNWPHCREKVWNIYVDLSEEMPDTDY